jgi:hypothetical protein
MSSIINAIQAKLDRVPEKIKAIQSSADTYAGRYPPEVIIDSDGKATVDMSVPPPIEISVLAGEAIYQMRSALDHLAFHLVKLNPNGITLPAKWEGSCEFPLITELKTGQITPLPLGTFSKLPGISRDAHTFIESVQPYYRIGAVNNSLRFLKELSNRDKHRHLAVTRSRSQVHHTRTLQNRIISIETAALDHGAELDVFERSIGGDSNVQVNFKLSGFISFNEPILGEGACSIPVQELLQYMLDAVQGTIVPAFDKLINNP